jgi:methionyl-tRNA synthetase
VVVLTNKYWDGHVPARGELSTYDEEVLSELSSCAEKVGQLIERYKLREALSEVMNLARLGNKYLADTEPWKLKKTDEKRTQTILNIALQIATHLSKLSEPFLPFTAQKLSDMLNIEQACWDNIEELQSDHKIKPAILLFSKIEDELIEQQLSKLKA